MASILAFPPRTALAVLLADRKSFAGYPRFAKAFGPAPLVSLPLPVLVHDHHLD